MMAVSSQCTLLFLLVSVWRVKGKIETTCESIIGIRCPVYQIVITDVNTTSSLAPKLLERCNGHNYCNVTNHDNECVEVTYWCSKEVHIVEMAESSADVELNMLPSSLSLMSKNYVSGEYRDARNIACTLKPVEERDKTRTLLVRIHDFTPFANSTDFCFKVTNVEESIICSGSQKIHKFPGRPLASTTGWNISMELAKAADHVPQIRFWIELDVSPKDDSKYQLNCNFHLAQLQVPSTKQLQAPGETQSDIPLSEQSSTDSKTRRDTVSDGSSVNIISAAAVLGTFLIGAALVCRFKSIKFPRFTSGKENDQIYTYIDIDDAGLKGTHEEAPSFLGSLQTIGPLSISSQLYPGSNMQNRKLPTLPRGIQRNHSLPEVTIHAANRTVHFDDNEARPPHRAMQHPQRKHAVENEDFAKRRLARNFDTDFICRSSSNIGQTSAKEEENAVKNNTKACVVAIEANDNTISTEDEITKGASADFDEDQESSKEPDSDEESGESGPENEYMGLSQEALNEEETSSRSSARCNSAYTLLAKNSRIDDVNAGTSSSDESNAEATDDNTSPSSDYVQMDGEETEIQKEPPFKNKEPDYLVLISDDVEIKQ